MDLAEKVKHLRSVEGELRGLGRPMTQVEIVKAMQEELDESISQAYMSQLESGKRVHLTASSRDLLSRFFKVHPGYLVSDPPDFSTDLLSTDLLSESEPPKSRLQAWLTESAAAWADDPALQVFLSRLSSAEDPHSYLVLFARLLNIPMSTLEHMVESLQTPYS
ncbi:MAG: transcriptional regulator [Ktedonobacteraceae bacterium]